MRALSNLSELSGGRTTRQYSSDRVYLYSQASRATTIIFDGKSTEYDFYEFGLNGKSYKLTKDPEGPGSQYYDIPGASISCECILNSDNTPIYSKYIIIT